MLKVRPRLAVRTCALTFWRYTWNRKKKKLILVTWTSHHCSSIAVLSKLYLCRLLFLEFFFFFFFFFLGGDRLWEGDLAGEQTNMNSGEHHAFCRLPLFIYLGKHDKRCPSRHLAAEPSHIGNWPFPFPLPFGLSLLLLPFGPRGELLIRGGAASRQSRGDASVFFPPMGYEMWNLSWKNSAFWIQDRYFKIEFAQFES